MILFTKVSLPYGWLGNMSPYPVSYGGKEWRTTEHLFQALRYSSYPEIQEMIRTEPSPMGAKMKAKAFREMLLNDDYEFLGERDLTFMAYCLLLKIEQHADIKQMLLETGTKEIVEDVKNRPHGSNLFWGAYLTHDGQLVGENWLGKLWMELRNDFNGTLQIPAGYNDASVNSARSDESVAEPELPTTDAGEHSVR